MRRCYCHGTALKRIVRPDEEELIGVFSAQLLAALDAPAAGAQADSIEAYIAGRLAGDVGQQWLDALALAQAIRSAELLGSSLALGANDVFEDLSGTERETAIRCGWDYISQGQRGLRRAFGILKAKDWRPPGRDKCPERCVFDALPREAANQSEASVLKHS